jgi:tagatose 6-phosphate kinase
MVLTVTFSPSIDKVYYCAWLSLTGVHRAVRCETYPAGKGINVARGVRSLGGEALALGFAGGHLGELLRALLEKEGIPERLTRTRSDVRLNPTFRDPARESDLHVLEPDQPVTEQEQAALLQTFRQSLERAKAVVFAGSGRLGVSASLVGQIVTEANDAGALSIVDSRDEPLRTAVRAKPFLLKPNAQELSDLAGRPLRTEDELIQAAQEVVERGVRNVVVSLGADGAILACADGVWKARPPQVRAINTVGCGDAMVAGLTMASLAGASPAETLRRGVAAGTVNVLLDSPGLVPAEAFEEMLPKVRLEQVRSG